MSLTKTEPWFATVCLVAYLDHRFEPILVRLAVTPAVMANLALLAVSSAVMVTIFIPWWRWVYPAIERALLRASHGVLRVGVVLAIAVTVLATGGVWAYVYPRVVPTPPEFEVPAPAVLDARLAMLRYKIAALNCNLARIAIERRHAPICVRPARDAAQEPKQV